MGSLQKNRKILTCEICNAAIFPYQIAEDVYYCGECGALYKKFLDIKSELKPRWMRPIIHYNRDIYENICKQAKKEAEMENKEQPATPPPSRLDKIKKFFKLI